MSFRDDREAAHRRADALEQELQSARAELDALKGARRRPRTRLALVIAGIACGAGAVGAVAYTVTSQRAQARRAQAAREEAQRAQMREEEARRAEQMELERAAAERAAAQRRAEETVRAMAAAASVPTEEIAWRGVLDEATGLALAPGTACEVVGAFSRGAGEARVRALRVACGGQEVYRAAAPPEGLRVGLREGPVFGADAHVYMLSYTDDTPSPSPRAMARVSSIQHTATVWREGPAPLRVAIHLRDVSDAREGATFGLGRVARSPAFAGVIERTARVTRVQGRAPVARGARCALAVRPVWEFPENCRVALRCGTTWLYGAREAGYLTCEVRDGRAVSALDENPTSDGGDPRLSWRAARVTVGDFTEAGAWEVDLSL